jgi:hypothetical protein
MLLALFSAEGLTSARRTPWLSAWALGGLAAISYDATTLMPFDDPFVGTNVFYLAWSLPLLAGVARRVLGVDPVPASPAPVPRERQPAAALAG